MKSQVDFSLADHKGVTTGMLLTFGLSMMIPVIALLYVKLEQFILRRAGVPPIEEHIASLKLPDESEEVAATIELRKAA